MTTTNEDGPIILIPKPSDDADDPLVSIRQISHPKHATE
jgi:hypothetical protein